MTKNSEVETDVVVTLRALPPEWEWAELGDVGIIRLGKTPRRIDYRDAGGHKIIKFRDVDEHGGIDWDNGNNGYVDSAPEVLRTLKELQDRDVLVTASAHMSEHIRKKVGIVSAIPGHLEGAYVVGEILHIRTKEGVHPEWVLYYLRSLEGYKAIQRRVHGVHLIASRAKNIGSSWISVGRSDQFWWPDSVWAKGEFPSERGDNPWTTSLLTTGCPH